MRNLMRRRGRHPRGRARKMRLALPELLGEGYFDRRGTQSAVARKYGVSRQYVSQVIKEFRAEAEEADVKQTAI
jgi:Homeodomain-like domain